MSIVYNIDLDRTIISSLGDPRPGFGNIFEKLRKTPNVSFIISTASTQERALRMMENFDKRIEIVSLRDAVKSPRSLAFPGIKNSLKSVDTSKINISIDDRSDVIDPRNVVSIIVSPYEHVNQCFVRHRYGRALIDYKELLSAVDSCASPSRISRIFEPTIYKPWGPKNFVYPSALPEISMVSKLYA
jgi:hypothetical protein